MKKGTPAGAFFFQTLERHKTGVDNFLHQSQFDSKMARREITK
jgi:hypothetical protein